MKKFFRNRWTKRALLFSLVVSMMVCTAFAEETTGSTATSTIISAFTTGFQQIATDAMSMIAAAAPIALGIAGTIFLAKKAIGWFKGMAK